MKWRLALSIHGEFTYALYDEDLIYDRYRTLAEVRTVVKRFHDELQERRASHLLCAHEIQLEMHEFTTILEVTDDVKKGVVTE